VCIINAPFDVYDRVDSYPTCFQLTVSMKLRSSEYQLRMRDYMTNKKLFVMKLVKSPDCRFCPGVPESIVHMLWECPKARKMWEEVKTWIKDKTDYELHMSPSYIILNIDIQRDESTPEIIWLILIIVRQYLYSSKCLEKIPSAQGAIKAIQQVEQIELSIATQHRKVEEHCMKWGNFLSNPATFDLGMGALVL